MFCVDHLWLPNTPMTFFVPESEFTVSPASFHRGGVNILFADGHVQFITNQIEEDVWVAIGSRNGHEVIREVP